MLYYTLKTKQQALIIPPGADVTNVCREDRPYSYMCIICLRMYNIITSYTYICI